MKDKDQEVQNVNNIITRTITVKEQKILHIQDNPDKLNLLKNLENSNKSHNKKQKSFVSRIYLQGLQVNCKEK